jgi:hypothetical protein
MKTKMIKKTLMNIAAIALAGTGIASAGTGSWSSWTLASGNMHVEYRYKLTSYEGSFLSASCDVEVRNIRSRMSRVQGIFDIAGNPDQTPRTFWLSAESHSGSDSISTCGHITNFRVIATY